MSAAAPVRSPGLLLTAASHWRIGFPFAPEVSATDRATHLLGLCVGAQARHVARISGDDDVEQVVCSTVLSGLCPQSVPGELLLAGVHAGRGRRSLALLQAYECSGWGFALRFFAKNLPMRRLLVSIVDADLHRSSIFATDEHWGRSGFGVTALMFSLPNDADLNLTIGRVERRPGTWGSDTRAFASLVHAIRRHHADANQAMIFVHFMAAHIRQALERAVGTDRISPNRFAEYGHCFGADPWIGMIEWHRSRVLAATTSVTAASLSNNGYYTLCDLALTPTAKMEFKSLPGDESSLLAAIDAVDTAESSDSTRTFSRAADLVTELS